LTTSHLAPDEPLSPELVLVLSPEERAQALAALGPPVWPLPRLRVAARPAPIVEHLPAPSIRRLVAARFVSLAVIFVAATILTLALSLVAHALRTP
jgi:hypothetical protein